MGKSLGIWWRRVSSLIGCAMGLLLSVSPASAWQGTVTRVLDGDSLLVQRGGEVRTIRLYGIDCPEHGQPGWREAKNATRALVQGHVVRIDSLDTDRYGRDVALVWCRGTLVNGALVRQGMAWVYPHFCKEQPLCRDLASSERIAKNERLGIWREVAPTPPWVWKKSGR